MIFSYFSSHRIIYIMSITSIISLSMFVNTISKIEDNRIYEDKIVHHLQILKINFLENKISKKRMLY